MLDFVASVDRPAAVRQGGRLGGHNSRARPPVLGQVRGRTDANSRNDERRGASQVSSRSTSSAPGAMNSIYQPPPDIQLQHDIAILE